MPPARPSDRGGYWAGTPYVEVYHPAQEPWRIALEARRGGVTPPDLDAPFTYCDIGCGCGHTLLALAAALPACRFYGVDVDPGHVDEARRLAERNGLGNVEFIEGAAQDLPPDAIPPCDFVTLYGVLSWVREDIAAGILSFVGRVLKPGGLLLASVNLESGWAQLLPVRRHLLEVYAAADGTAEARLRAAIASARATFGDDTEFARKNPIAAEYVGGWRKSQLRYLPHELMNAAWRLFGVAGLFEELGEAGLEYAGPFLRDDAAVREKLAGLIDLGGGDAEIESRLSAALCERFRAFVFRRAGGAAKRGAQFAPKDALLGAVTALPVEELFPEDVVKLLAGDNAALAARAVSGEGLTLADVGARASPAVRLQLFACLNKLATEGALARYCAPPRAAGLTPADPIAPAHPLTSALLRARSGIAFSAHLPSPVLGGAVRVPGMTAAVLRAHLEGGPDGIRARAEALRRAAMEEPGFWAVEDAAPRGDPPDFDLVMRRYGEAWLPFLQRLGVIVPAPAAAS